MQITCVRRVCCLVFWADTWPGLDLKKTFNIFLVDKSDCLVAVSNTLDIHVFFNPF